MGVVTEAGLWVPVDRDAEILPDFDKRILAPIKACLRLHLNQLRITEDFDVVRTIGLDMTPQYRAVDKGMKC